MIINYLRRCFAHPLETDRSALMSLQANETTATLHENRILLILVIRSGTPFMSSWMFACPHRLRPSRGHATSRGKSMTLHIACHFQRRLCSCADSLVGFRLRIRPPDTWPRNDVIFKINHWKRRLIVAVCSGPLAHSGEAFILRLSRIHDFVLKYRILHLTRNQGNLRSLLLTREWK